MCVLISVVFLINSYKTTILILYIVVSGNPTLLISLFYKLPVSHIVIFSFLKTDIYIVIVDTNETVVAVVLRVRFQLLTLSKATVRSKILLRTVRANLTPAEDDPKPSWRRSQLIVHLQIKHTENQLHIS